MIVHCQDAAAQAICNLPRTSAPRCILSFQPGSVCESSVPDGPRPYLLAPLPESLPDRRGGDSESSGDATESQSRPIEADGLYRQFDRAPIPNRTALAKFTHPTGDLAGQEHEALVPVRHLDGSVAFWSDAYLRKLKALVQERTGVEFSLKTSRATFCQASIDRGVQTSAVSKAMRHASTATTEKYYGRIRTDAAFRELEQAYEPVQKA